MNEPKQNTCFRLDKSYVERLDEIGDKEYRSRSNLLTLAVRHLLNHYDSEGNLEDY